MMTYRWWMQWLLHNHADLADKLEVGFLSEVLAESNIEVGDPLGVSTQAWLNMLFPPCLTMPLQMHSCTHRLLS